MVNSSVIRSMSIRWKSIAMEVVRGSFLLVGMVGHSSSQSAEPG